MTTRATTSYGSGSVQWYVGWPMSWNGSGLARVARGDATAMCLLHLARTALGSYYADPDYGSLFHIARGQGHTLGSSGSLQGSAMGVQGGSGRIRQALAHYRGQAARYVPWATLTDVRITPQSTGNKDALVVHVSYKNADGSSGRMPDPAQAAIAGSTVSASL